MKNYSSGAKFKKKMWTKEEDDALVDLVGKYGTNNWVIISENMENRTGKQCRERWLNKHNPGIKNTQWTEEEDRLIIEKQKILGNSWVKIAEFVKGRSSDAIKTRYSWLKTKAAQRQQFSNFGNFNPQQTNMMQMQFITQQQPTSQFTQPQLMQQVPIQKSSIIQQSPVAQSPFQPSPTAQSPYQPSPIVQSPCQPSPVCMCMQHQQAQQPDQKINEQKTKKDSLPSIHEIFRCEGLIATCSGCEGKVDEDPLFSGNDYVFAKKDPNCMWRKF